MNKVEVEFRKHYEEVVKIKYISNLIHYYSIDYDKRIRRTKDRFILTLDQEMSDEDESTTFKDTLKSDFKIDDNLYNSLFEFTSNANLLKGLKTLTDNQLMILKLIYLREYKQIEIAEMFNTTPQNISNQHRRSLEKLNLFIKNEGDYG